jgi:hypothetical protein
MLETYVGNQQVNGMLLVYGMVLVTHYVSHVIEYRCGHHHVDMPKTVLGLI